MIEAEVINYRSTLVILGGWQDADAIVQRRATYVPSERILVDGGIPPGHFHPSYNALTGEKAEEEYHRILSQGQQHTRLPEKINVPYSFVTWAKALHLAANPPEELSDLLRM